MHFSRFYPADALERGWPETVLASARREGRFEDEGWRVRKDGSAFWASVVVTAIHGPSGELRGFSKITRDLTERKRLEQWSPTRVRWRSSWRCWRTSCAIRWRRSPTRPASSSSKARTTPRSSGRRT